MKPPLKSPAPRKNIHRPRQVVPPVEEQTKVLDPNWNQEITDDLEPQDLSQLIVFSRDWTIETIDNQIEQGNIQMNPGFQRRNAWDDTRRSRLVESLIAKLPVPEIVLAEDPRKPRSFIIIDGKQRLLTINGFIHPQSKYWDNPHLQPLKLLPKLSGKSYEDLKGANFSDEYRCFINADIRCTIIGGIKNTDVLYDVFHRLNSGSVPLSTQELRQVLHKGDFADFLIKETNEVGNLHRVLSLDAPDTRLRDAEILLRFIALLLFAKVYRGNLKKFLDDAMGSATAKWDIYHLKVVESAKELNNAISSLENVFSIDQIGRKFNAKANRFERRFNRVLFEVEAFYFRLIPLNKLKAGKARFLKGFHLRVMR